MFEGPQADPSANRPLLLCLSHLRWNFVYQRPQHLMTRAARHYDVVYWEEPEYGGAVTEPELRLTLSDSDVRVATPMLPEGLDVAATDAAQRSLINAFVESNGGRVGLLWYYTPMALSFADDIVSDISVYDCMDELTLFAGASMRLTLLEKRLLRRVNLVFTGGKSLQRSKETAHPRVHCFPSAVDVRHFAKARLPGAEPQDQAGLPHPRVGFFGVVDERMDTGLLARLAELRPSVHFIMIGPVAKISQEDLPRAANLHWLGGRSYDELPGYLSGWDAGFMPFAMNEATRFISPTKTPEFLAAGVPLVSTPINDVVSEWAQPGFVKIAKSADEMAAHLDHLIEAPKDAWLEQVDRKLLDIDWDLTWREMTSLIDQHLGSAAVPSGSTARRAERSYDWMVVGAGFAGAVMAERLARERGDRVLVIDKRPHIAGNAFDCLDDAGVLVHKYGPHIFHTNSQAIVDYLSRFTEWRPYEHRVKAVVDEQLVPFPINLDTINQLYGLALTSDELEGWFSQRAETPAAIRTSEDVIVARVGRELYEKFFRGYTRKQWGLDPSQLDASVTARVPVRTNQDDRYFTDKFQAMPRAGYTKMFERLLDHENITVRLDTDYKTTRASYKRLVWTGPVDEFFGNIYGRLPYRSLSFRHETLDVERLQDVAVVNYPQTEHYTRITEYKHLTGQVHPQTSISYEYPTDDGDPYYPVPRPENMAIFRRYQTLVDAMPETFFVGRLATYRYLNMDQVVGQALATFGRIQNAVSLTGQHSRPAGAASLRVP